MGLHAALKPVTDRADLKVHALERAEGAFHFGQALVIKTAASALMPASAADVRMT